MAIVTAGSTVVDLLEGAAIAEPGRLAVSDSDGDVSYGELLEQARRLAARLREADVEPGGVVGLCVQRSSALCVAGLGIFQAGCAYVAIDPRYPEDRIRWMLEDSGASALVCDEKTWKRLGSGLVPHVVLGARKRPGLPGALAEPRRVQRLHGSDRDDGLSHPDPDDLAYLVYTSGSTGKPKGVAVDHASLSNLIAWHTRAFALQPGDRCSQVASPGFDAAVWEIWPALAARASVHIVPEELRSDPAGLRDFLVEEEIAVSFVPTALAEVMLGLAWPERTRLRTLLTGGDALAARPRPGLPFAVVNNYGLSETTVVATSGVVEPEGIGPPTIGRAIDGVMLEVVDENLNPVVPGEPGELLIGGLAVARGYVGRPDMTAERFLSDGFERRCRTGDLVRERPDGTLDFLGRVDDQLSIRGFRVEPGEVTAALNAHPAVASSAVSAFGLSSADRRLVAYLVAAAHPRPSDAELAEFLGAVLPEYMIPDRYIWLEELPLTTHGKLDRAALPHPVGSLPAPEGAGPFGQSPTEAKISSDLAELLDIPTVAPEENFFLLGGHSMLGAQLIVRIEADYGVELSLRYLFDHPTVRELAAEVERVMAEGRGA